MNEGQMPTKILLIEDNLGDVDLLRAILGETGSDDFDIYHAHRIKDGLDALRIEDFDIVLLDLSLPDSDGMDTLTAMTNAARGIPIVVLTGNDDESAATDIVKEGGQDYLVKGRIDQPVLTRAIRYAIDRSRLQSEMHYLAHRDPLTDLPNRALLLDRLGQAIAHSRRVAGIMALHFVDLDDFSSVNHNFGFDAGDCLLKGVATRLRATVRASDTIARISGDEFAIIHTQISDVSDIATLAGRFTDILSEPFLIGDEQIAVSATVGIAVYPRDAETAEDMLQRADLALYTAKEKARGGYLFYDTDEFIDVMKQFDGQWIARSDQVGE